MGQYWPAEYNRIRRLKQEQTHLSASEEANRADQLLTSFFGDDFVSIVVKEDR